MVTQPSLEAFRNLNDALRSNLDVLDRTGRLARVGGWDYDVASERITWSAETFRIHGVSPDYRPRLQDAFQFYPPEARSEIQAAFEKAIEARQGWDLELPFDQADGQRIWVRALGIPVFVGGRVVRISGAIQDVTDLRTARLALKRESERAILAADSGGIGIWEWDIESGRVHADAWMHRLYGLEPRDAVSSFDVFFRRLYPDDVAAVQQALDDAMDDRGPYEAEFRIVWADGSIHHIREAGAVTRDAGGRPTRMIGAAWDVSEARRLAADLAREHELLQVTLVSIADGVITTDVGGAVTWLNPVAEQMTGWTSGEASARPLRQVFQVVHEQSRAALQDPLEGGLGQGRFAGDADALVLIARGGAEFAIEASASPIRGAQDKRLGMVLVFNDVTEPRRLAREMRHRASHDPLTGLFNRAEFERRLSIALAKAREESRPSAMLYIDFDQFKIVNDSCGHSVGDELLVEVVGLLSDSVRASDTLARLGGDEFGVLLNDCALSEAQRVAQGVCDRMETFRFIRDDKRFRIGASIGLVAVDDRWSSAAAIQQAADAACYAAKDAGGNRVHVWRDSDEALKARKREMQWATRLETALDEDGFTLFHQMIEPLGVQRQGLSLEVLLRLADADGVLTLPGIFLPAAERFHLSARIDRWVLGRVIGWMRQSPFLHRLDIVNVNLSGKSVGDPSFHRWAVDLLEAAGPMIRQKLGLEITETAVVIHREGATRFISEVREMGCRVALDDFGAGASSFGYLKTLPVDFLKIDGEFIRGMATDPLDAAAVRCFVDVAQVLGVKTVAEFVETPEVLDLLKQLGVDFVQGNLIHRPAPIGEFTAVA
jgi:diguanylate cyclase (GGDEF)-like protein/PAS domain S-box-containing protein